MTRPSRLGWPGGWWPGGQVARWVVARCQVPGGQVARWPGGQVARCQVARCQMARWPGGQVVRCQVAKWPGATTITTTDNCLG